MDEFCTSWNVLSRLHTEIFQRLLRKDAKIFTTWCKKGAIQLFFGVLLFHGFFTKGSWIGWEESEKAQINGEGDSTLIIKTDMNYVFPWGVVGRENARVNGERDSTLIKMIWITFSLGWVVGREKALVNRGGGQNAYQNWYELRFRWGVGG